MYFSTLCKFGPDIFFSAKIFKRFILSDSPYIYTYKYIYNFNIILSYHFTNLAEVVASLQN